MFLVGTTKLGVLGHLLEASFGSNLAYAALLRLGKLQGDDLACYAKLRHSEVVRAHGLFKKEDDAFPVVLDGDEIRTGNLVAETQAYLVQVAKIFATLMLAMAVVSLIGLFASAMAPDFEYPNWIVIIVGMMFFLPVPICLLWTYSVCGNCENRINKEYSNFFTACDHLQKKPGAEAQKAIELIRKNLAAKPAGPLKRFFSPTG